MTLQAAALLAPGGDAILVVAVTLPMAGIMLSLLFRGRGIERLAIAVLFALLVVSAFIFMNVLQENRVLTYIVGGWSAPLGITLRADGLSAAMMMTASAVSALVGLYACADFRPAANPALDERAHVTFFIMLPAICGAMNVVCLGGDLFTLYVALELLTFAAVPLVSLDGRAETLQAALRYLLFALFGSIFYLLGTVLLYGAYTTLDIVLLSQAIRADAVTTFALALMTTGLLAKTALFPLHLWLPPAHAGAPAPASAILSALVVKGSFVLVVRLWFDLMPGIPGFVGANLLGALGAAAIAFGGLMAIRQQRLKLLVAYSTVAQLGYLFLIFPVAFDPLSGQIQSGAALAGGILQAASHATAKAAMFMAAGTIYLALGHDRINDLAGAGRRVPLSLLAFAIGGLVLAGLPPGGAFAAKSLLTDAANTPWWWEWTMTAGSLLTSIYLVVVLLRAFASAPSPQASPTAIPRYREISTLLLAFGSLLLGGFGGIAMELLQVGRTPSAPVHEATVFTAAAIWKALWPVAIGALVAIALMRREGSRTRVQTRPRSVNLLDRFDGMLRQWSLGSSSLLFLTLLLGAAMLATH